MSLIINKSTTGRDSPSYVESTDDLTPCACSYVDFQPVRNYESRNDSKLRDMLELIARRLNNLTNRRYFSSPEFEYIAKINAEREVSSATQAATRAAASADTASKAAIAAVTACDSVIGENMKLAILLEQARKPTASKLHAASKESTPQAVLVTASCPATPERIRLYYDVKPSGQYPNVNVPSCVATTRIQNTNYPTTPINWLRQPYFNDNSQISYADKEQSPFYDTLATKNWTVVTTTYSNSQFTPIGRQGVVEIDTSEKKQSLHTLSTIRSLCIRRCRERDRY